MAQSIPAATAEFSPIKPLAPVQPG
jgi:hypothetical protein